MDRGKRVLLLFLVTAEAEGFLYLGKDSYLEWNSAVTFSHLNLQLPFSFTMYFGVYESILSHFS